MEIQRIRDYVKARLGSPSVIVELEDYMIDAGVEDALYKFNHYMCAPDLRVEKNCAGSVVIPLKPEDRGVLLVKHTFPDEYRSYTQMSVFELMYRMVFPAFPISDWYLLKSFYETYQRVRGTDPDWFLDEGSHVLYVDASSGPYDIFYIVSQDLTLANIDIIKKPYLKDFLDYILAICKTILGRIRGKFGGTIPVPGGTLSTDSDALISEGKEIMDKIEEKLEQRAKYVISPIMWG